MKDRLALAERAVPRYTSYPTAPYFSGAVGANAYAEWLAALPPSSSLSLYIHVPYCTNLCLYCGCNTRAVRQDAPLQSYTERLLDEIALLGAALAGGRVEHLHWGGGTPSILGEQRLATIAATLGAFFDLSAIREHAIELDPRHMSKRLAQALAEIGVNRASLGVQDFSPGVQKAIGRVQPFAQVEETVGWLRGAGIANINIDLMYGLPGQSADDAARSAALAASLRPGRLALFGYAHVPWMKSRQRLIDSASLPGPAERFEQARRAGAVFQGAGYMAIGLDHFAAADDSLAGAARGGTLRRNFQGYTADDADALLGLGASAIGKLPQGYVQNAVDVAGYSRAVEAGQFATVKGLALSPDDRLRARIIERLMCDLAVDLDAIAPGEDFSVELDALASLEAEGLVSIEGRRVAICEEGRPFLRLAAAAFDVYLPANQARHSVAV